MSATTMEPIRIKGNLIARSFWGRRWCAHLESFSDYANRLPRGRSYARNGSILKLDVLSGAVVARVSGRRARPYVVTVRIKRLPAAVWEAIKTRCSGRIGSVLELLRGSLSDEVMAIVTDPDTGLFPKPREITLECSCPDWANMCKHVAAVLYGIGHRFDTSPELLFRLRKVDPAELIAAELALPAGADADAADTLAEDRISAVFDIDLDADASPEETR